MQLKRRTLIGALAGFSVWPALATAQSPAKIPTIGVLAPGSEASDGPLFAATVARLRELGWVDGRNVKIEYRWAEGRNERISAIAAEFAQLGVDVIVASGNVPLVAKPAPETPIVAAAMGDPVRAGVAQKFAHPGGNLTGTSIQSDDLAPKRVQLLREIVPSLGRLAVMGYSPGVTLASEMQSAKAYATTLGLNVATISLRGAGDIAPAFESIKGRAGGLYVTTTPFTSVNRAQIFGLALGAHLPSVTGNKRSVATGALISYGVDFDDLFRRAGDMVDRILRGEKPGDLPIQQSTKFELAVNLKTAKALDLAIPTAILAAAGEAIE